ncbi:MAG: ABC transporter substrate-binding protein [Oscillospiraceae bacterium]|nr:ABC transporter substrate-binding protein [Oscillospiraceae bacterium]
MKKAFAWILTLVMAISLVACGANSATPAGSTTDSTAPSASTATAGNTNLSVIWWGNQTRNERTQAALDLYAEQNPGVTFDAQFAEWSDYWNKLATASAAHSLPDVVQMDYKYLKQYVENGLLVDLKPYIDSGVLDVSGIDPGILEAGSVDGGVYAVCIGVNAPALLYNKTFMDENGFTVKDNMTMDEFIALSKEVYKKTGMKTNVSYGAGENFIDYTMRAQSIELYDGNKFGAKSAEDFVPYFSIYENGIKDGWLISPEVFAERTLGSVEQDPLVFGSGADQRSWCTLAYSNLLTAFQAAADAEGVVELGITTWPSADPAKSDYLKPGQFFSVTVDSKDPEAAAKILDYWTNSLECNEILLAERGIPASSKTADALAPKLDSLQQKITDYINNVVTPTCSAISPAAPENSAEVLKLYDSLQEQVCYGKLTAAEAAQKLFDEGNAILAG